MNTGKEYILVIPPSGPCRLVPFDNDIDKHNARIQQLIGGWFEEVACLGQDFIMLVDEEGSFKEYNVNPVASAAARYADVIVGTAVILRMGLDDEEGEVYLYGMDEQTAVKWLLNLSELKHIPTSITFEPSDGGVI